MPYLTRLLIVCVALGICGGSAIAGTGRYALLIGSNQGRADEPSLRYAGRDAHRVADVLVALGRFLPENVIVLTDPTPARVRDAVARIDGLMRAEGGGGLFVVFYSGHADALSLHLGADTVAWSELRDLASRAAAATRLLIVDACRSGQATRVKGIRIDEPFALPVDGPAPEGVAIVSSATAGESAQESEDLQSSFFTHHLIAGLRGIADSNGDARITLTEAFRYASERTMASSAATIAGIQHPTYHVDLRGRAELVLSFFDRVNSLAALRLAPNSQYLLWQGGASGPLAFEGSVGNRARTVWLEPGRYAIQRRVPDRLEEGTVTLAAGAIADVASMSLKRVEYDQLVRKGGGRRVAYAATLWAGTGSPLVPNLPMPVDIRLGLSADIPAFTLDAQLALSRTSTSDPEINAAVTSASLAVGARKVLDVGRVALSAGLRVGALVADQRYNTERVAPGQQAFAPFTETLVRADLRLTPRTFAGVESGLRAYFLGIEDSEMGEQSNISVYAGWHLLLGTGARW